jgi:hypothetical protein
MRQSSEELGKEETYLNAMKSMSEKPVANISLNEEN